MIKGETGVGKELFAQAMYRLSKKSGEFIAINIAGLDDIMLSDTCLVTERVFSPVLIWTEKGFWQLLLTGFCFSMRSEIWGREHR